MTIEDLEQLKADGMIDDRKYQQLKAKISMQGYQPVQQVAPSNAYDMTNYGKNLQAQAEPMEQNFNPSFGYDERSAKIAQLEQQIAMVKERIARNERALVGKSYDDANNQIAALEMRKINSSDPTTLWRWQQQRQDTKEANANTKAKAAEQFANTVNMWNSTRLPEGTAAREQMISNLNAAIRDGRNAGADVSDLLTLKAKWEKQTYNNNTNDSDDNNTNDSPNYGVGSESEQLAGLLKTTLDTAKTSTELEQFRKDHPKLKAEQLSLIDTKIAELKKKEKANADEREFRAWVEKQTGKKASALSDRTLKTYRNVWKNSRGR